MVTREEQIRKFILNYELEVPQYYIDREMNYIQLEMRHRMQYDTLTGGRLHLNPWGELEEMKEELYQAAFYEAKSDLVIKEIIAKQNFIVSKEELEAEAEAMAQRQNCSVDMGRQFFGNDLAMLEGDVKRQKAEKWILTQTD